MDKVLLQYSRDNFYYFNYHIAAKKESLNSIHSGMYQLKNFFSDENMQNIFNFYSQTEENGIYVVEEQERAIGASTFFCYLCYYYAFKNGSQIYFVCEPKVVKTFVDKIIELTYFLKPLTKLDTKYSEIKRTIEFSNAGKIRFYSDIAYNFLVSSKKANLLIFDNAVVKNFNKLCSTTELLVKNYVSEKTIMNFNSSPIFYNSENGLLFKKEFKDYLKLLKLQK